MALEILLVGGDNLILEFWLYRGSPRQQSKLCTESNINIPKHLIIDQA